MFSLITTRIAGWLAGVGGIILAIFAIYGKGRSDAKNVLKQEATNDAIRRTQAAVRSGDAVDTSGNGLRADDGHRRD